MCNYMDQPWESWRCFDCLSWLLVESGSLMRIPIETHSYNLLVGIPVELARYTMYVQHSVVQVTFEVLYRLSKHIFILTSKFMYYLKVVLQYCMISYFWCGVLNADFCTTVAGWGIGNPQLSQVHEMTKAEIATNSMISRKTNQLTFLDSHCWLWTKYIYCTCSFTKILNYVLQERGRVVRIKNLIWMNCKAVVMVQCKHAFCIRVSKPNLDQINRF